MLAREYQALISYVLYLQVPNSGAYMNIAAELEKPSKSEITPMRILG